MTPSLFCPGCGRESKEGLCTPCFLKHFNLIEHPSMLELEICPTCRACFVGGRWTKYHDYADAVTPIAMSQLNIHPDANELRIALKPQVSDGCASKVHVRVDAVVQRMDVFKEFDVEVRIKKRACDRCSLIAGGYYEGIVQVRASGRTLTEMERHISEKIAHTVIKQIQELSKNAFISDIKHLKEGMDIYVGAIKIGRQISKAIIDKFGGNFSEASKLVGQRDGKNIYRISFAVRIPNLMPGDIISLRDSVIQITDSRKKVIGIDLMTGARFISDAKKLKGVKLLCHESDAEATILTMVQDDEIQILDPDSYKPMTLPRPPFLTAESGDDVLVVKTEKGMFILPKES
ncbi:MAG: NMD3-related protein [Methanosarcinales archaeon Met12]|nr:MAG: NMD3-related protein [Methanosarcinales archaeon Met12]